MRPSRRLLFAGLAALALAGPAAAANKLVDAAKVFPLLDGYLKLPAGERSHFQPTYMYIFAGKPLTASMWLVEGGRRTPLPMRADGRVGFLPTLAQLHDGKVEIAMDAGQKVNINIDIEPTARPAAEMDAHELAVAIAQAGPGSKKAAGLMAMIVPKLHAVKFKGIGAGEAVLADGRRVPLPLDRGEPVYDPAKLPDARTLHFPKPPVRLSLN